MENSVNKAVGFIFVLIFFLSFFDFVKYATCKNRQSKNDDQKFYVKTENREVEVFKTDFCHLKEKSFNEYLKNNVDEYKMREITVRDVILVILSVVIFIRAGVFLMKCKM